jgi:hypothetical protein
MTLAINNPTQNSPIKPSNGRPLFSVRYELGMHKHDGNLFQSPIVAVDHLRDPGVDGRIILRWIFEKWDVGVWIRSIWLRIGTVSGHLRMH